MPDAAGQSFEKPDVRPRGIIDVVSEPFAPHFGKSDLDAALVADHTAVLHALVLAAQALPIRYRTENARAKQAVTLRFEGAVVDGLRLGDFSVRPRADLFRRSQTDPNAVKFPNQADTIIRAATEQG